MRAIRLILVFSLCVVVLANAVHFFAGAGDRRVDEATIHDVTYSTKETRQELSDAIAAAHRRVIVEQAVFGAVFVCLCTGIALTTRAILRSSDMDNVRAKLAQTPEIDESGKQESRKELGNQKAGKRFRVSSFS